MFEGCGVRHDDDVFWALITVGVAWHSPLRPSGKNRGRPPRWSFCAGGTRAAKLTRRSSNRGKGTRARVRFLVYRAGYLHGPVPCPSASDTAFILGGGCKDIAAKKA
jgi:hypothetical protein